MILVKTEAGQLALKDRSVKLTPRQRSAFILFDGKRTADDVIGAGLGVVRDDIEQMMVLGLLEPMGGAYASPRAALAANEEGAAAEAVTAQAGAGQRETAVDTRSPQARYQAAYPIATRLTAGLGLRGFRLNLQVEGTSSYEELSALAPKIRDAVGADKAAELDRALGR